MTKIYNSRDSKIDFFRGIAILGVVLVHVFQIYYTQAGSKTFFFTQIFDLGKYGVELFFIVSGYLLMNLYGNESKLKEKKYIRRRFLRIFPLWFVFLNLQFLLYKVFNSGNWKTVKNANINLPSIFQSDLVIYLLGITFTLWISGSLWNSLIYGGWSIQSEVAHYVAFPLLTKFKFKIILCLLILINFITLFLKYYKQINLFHFETYLGNIYLKYLSDTWLRLSFYSTFGYFLFGIALSKIVKSNFSVVIFEKSMLQKSQIWLLFVYIITFIFLPLPFGIQWQALASCIFVIFIGLKIKTTNYFFRILAKMGEYSYFIYFFHFYIILCIKFGLANFPIYRNNFIDFFQILIIAYVVLVISSNLGRVSWKYFESRFIKLGR